ncbi:MAG: cation-efflux pump, partial [Actinomycetota bacterium]|nr:cation-efflux pump [Actinomycetota bacterium]
MVAALARRPQPVALASLLIGVVLVIAKLVVGLLTGSLGILSEAVHSMLDVVASGFALFAVRTAAKPADRQHPYGHGRAENLAAFAEGMLLLFTALGIAYAAINRLFVQGAAVNAAWYAIALLVAGMVIEAGRAYVLRAVGRQAGSAALEADAANRGADVLSSLGVLAGLIGVRLGYSWADAVAALLVAAVIGRAAGMLVWRAGDILIDRSPQEVEEQLVKSLRRVPGVRDVKMVRVRHSGSQLLGDVRLSARRTLSVEGAEALREAVREAVAGDLPNLTLTLEVESDVRAADLVERVHAAAARYGLVSDLHNVTVEREGDGTLHLTMHAKMPGQISLREATKISSGLEAALREEFPEASRIDIHLEPLEPNLVRGEDVTAARRDLAERVREICEGHPDVVRCRDVELSARNGAIYAHVVAEMAPSAPLESAHAVETRLEELVRAGVPELEDVVARVTA